MDINRFISKIDRFYIEIAIVDSNQILKSESTTVDDRIRNSIRFGDPNRISLVLTKLTLVTWTFLRPYISSEKSFLRACVNPALMVFCLTA